jgi:hypothetical protein
LVLGNTKLKIFYSFIFYKKTLFDSTRLVSLEKIIELSSELEGEKYQN